MAALPLPPPFSSAPVSVPTIESSLAVRLHPPLPSISCVLELPLETAGVQTRGHKVGFVYSPLPAYMMDAICRQQMGAASLCQEDPVVRWPYHVARNSCKGALRRTIKRARVALQKWPEYHVVL